MEKGTRRGRTTERREGGGRGRRREIGDKEGRRSGKAGGEGGRWKEGREALCPEGILGIKSQYAGVLSAYACK